VRPTGPENRRRSPGAIPATILLSTILLGTLVGLVVWWQYTLTPEYSFRRLCRAIARRDPAGFGQFVNMAAVSGEVLDALPELVSRSWTRIDIGELGPVLAERLATLFRPQLAEALTRAGSDWAGTGNWPLVDPGRFRFRGFRVLQRGRREAVLGVTFDFPQYDTVLQLGLRMRRQASYWQAVGFTDPDGFRDQLVDLERQRVAASNAPVQAAIDRAVRCEDVYKRTSGDRSGLSRTIEYRFRLRNLGRDAIVRAEVGIVCRGPDRQELTRVNATSRLAVRPGGSRRCTWPEVVSLLSPQQARAYELDNSDLSFEAEVRVIEFGSGQVLKLSDPRDPVDELAAAIE
jgi:hypothetical protein